MNQEFEAALKPQENSHWFPRCGCCHEQFKVLITSREERAVMPAERPCKCHLKPVCAYCGRCEEHHQCSNRFMSFDEMDDYVLKKLKLSDDRHIARGKPWPTVERPLCAKSQTHTHGMGARL